MLSYGKYIARINNVEIKFLNANGDKRLGTVVTGDLI